MRYVIFVYLLRSQRFSMPSIITRFHIIALFFIQILNPIYGSTFIALDDIPTQNKIYDEVVVLKDNPDQSTILSAMGFAVANESRTPHLYNIVNHMAQKLSLPVPLILIFTGNPLSTAAEHCGIDFKCNAFAWSLAKNFGLICIGEDLIQCLSPQELEAIVAHELSHIHHNHVPKQILLMVLFHIFGVKIIEALGLNNKAVITSFGLAVNSKVIHVSAFDVAPYILDLITIKLFSRYCENEADATAAGIIDDHKQLSNAIFKIGKISNLKRRVIADTIAEVASTHPLSKHRAQHLEALAQQKASTIQG